MRTHDRRPAGFVCAAALVLGAALLAGAAEAAAAGYPIWLVSVGAGGGQVDGTSENPSLSADGRFVAFDSWAPNLVPGDTNDDYDVFVYDRQTGATERVSVASDGTQADGWSGSFRPSISADGRFVAFSSEAPNLVPGDMNGSDDVFVHDRETGLTELVSVASDGTQGNRDSGSFGISISTDGRFVAFDSFATNLVPGDTNGYRDVFVHDRQTGATERVSVASDGTQGDYFSGVYGISISADGRFVAFDSEATNLVPGDTNVGIDVFVHDRQTGATERVSVASDGAQGDDESGRWSLGISGDGRFVAFDSYASNLVPGDADGWWDVFVHDRQTGATERVSVAYDGTQGNHNSGWDGISLSADGRFVAFSSGATNLVPWDTNGTTTDVFVVDRDPQQEQFPLSLAAGWSLVSIPVEPDDPARDSVFPPATCEAVWEYQNPGGYVVPTEIHPKVGYWVKTTEPVTVTVLGLRPADKSVSIATGWDLVGVVGESEADPTQPVPPAPPVSACWEYLNPGGYAVPAECTDGHGFWMKATEDTVIWESAP